MSSMRPASASVSTSDGRLLEAHPRRTAHERHRPAGGDHRLRRDAVPQVGGTTDDVALDHRHVGAEALGVGGGGVPGRTTTDDHEASGHDVQARWPPNATWVGPHAEAVPSPRVVDEAPDAAAPADRERARRRAGPSPGPGRRHPGCWRRAVPVPLRPLAQRGRGARRVAGPRARHGDDGRGHASPGASCSSATPASSSSPRSPSAAAEIQLFVSKAVIGDDGFAAVKELDRGDWVGVHGTVMTTRAGELSVKVERLELLAKSLRPLPDKWHGLSDPDTRFRQRYVDLIVNADARRAFDVRHEVIASFRRTFRERGFTEVETPVLHVEAGGAHARAVRRPLQRARHAAVPAHRAGAAPQAADRRRHGPRVRDRPGVPQRGPVATAQHRVHDDGVVRGLRRRRTT